MKIRSSRALALGLGVAIALLARAEPSPAVVQEINHLLRHISDSDCEFKRNGVWADAKAAEAHVRDKYDYLIKLGRIEATKDFIDKAASESSFTGQPYEVRCRSDSPLTTNAWLNDELTRYRASRRR